MPAMYSLPTDSSVMIAYMTKMMLGGIIMPRVPPTAEVAAAKLGL